MKSTFHFSKDEHYCSIVKQYDDIFVFIIMLNPNDKYLKFQLNKTEFQIFQNLLKTNTDGIITDTKYDFNINGLFLKYDFSITYFKNKTISITLTVNNKQEYTSFKIDEIMKNEILKFI